MHSPKTSTASTKKISTCSNGSLNDEITEEHKFITTSDINMNNVNHIIENNNVNTKNIIHVNTKNDINTNNVNHIHTNKLDGINIKDSIHINVNMNDNSVRRKTGNTFNSNGFLAVPSPLQYTVPDDSLEEDEEDLLDPYSSGGIHFV